MDVLWTDPSAVYGVEWYAQTLDDALQTHCAVLRFVMGLRDPSLPCAQFACPHVKWYTEVEMRSTTKVYHTILHPTVTYLYYSCLYSSNTTTDFLKDNPQSRIIGVFLSGGTVAVRIILRSCTKVSDLAVGGVLVYGGISIDRHTDLYIIRDGPLTARRYRDEILRPIVVPYAAAIGDDFILMDNNCRPHHPNLVEDFFFEEGIVRMEWPACSLDMNQ
ncbi:transposable element Tcb2 transposase [Trichonephila clavipes]|nr:transposable element Tcb2 transposase [Trichonephila clavipes]